MTMTIKKHIYLGLALCTAVLTGCSDDVATLDTLSGDGTKTPLTVTALLDASSKVAKTRAFDKTFESGDAMVAYLRHVKWSGNVSNEEEDKRIPVTADQAPKLVEFTCTGSEPLSQSPLLNDIFPFDADRNVPLVTADEVGSMQAANLSATTKLYWDDFSSSTSEGTDLRTDGHYLQSYYGYCYNGGTPTEDLEQGDNKINGVIKWAVQADQSGTTEPTNFKKSDLLWSAEQEPVSYAHSDKVNGNRPGLIIPYTHAMSKVTIKVTAGDGFDSNYDFTTTVSNDETQNTTVTLKDVRLKCTATAPTASLTYPAKTEVGAKGDVTMKPGTGTGTRSFDAIIVPSVLTVGNIFATITYMDGNTYNIPVTEAIVDATEGWGKNNCLATTGIDEDVDNGTAQVKPQTRANEINKGKGYQMKSGVHYILNVTVSKTEVTVSATILDWDETEAEGVGEIHFANDIKDKGTIDDYLKTNGFDVYQSATTTFGTRATNVHWNKTSSVWKYKPVIYWQGGTPEYFRALSNVRADAAGTTDKNESLIMENTRDALWGTTAAHSGTDADGQDYNYVEGAAIKPRTGDVPLQFYHAMSKITFNLVDANKIDSDPLARLDLHGATIQLTDLATGGMLNLYTGEITPDAINAGQKTFSEDKGAVPSRMGFFAAEENGTTTTYKDDVTLREYIITPQTIGDKATVIVTLADGTVYKVQLNKCKTEVIQDGASTYPYVNKWESGRHYVYTITLAKEQITFRALVEEWKNETAGGNATLEWD